jgi:APA family basic amino acid/polyamine antiporter
MATGNKAGPGLIRALGLWSTIAVIVGSMIGQAVFLVASDMARELGSPTMVLVVWIIGGIIVLFGAFCYAELGAALPQVGGDYVYLSRGLSPICGFLFGWTSSIIMRPCSAAIIAAGLLRFTSFLFPAVTSPIFSLSIVMPFTSETSHFTLTVAQLLATAAIIFVMGINYLGVRSAGQFQVLLTSLKVMTLLGIVVLGLAFGKFHGTEPAFIESPTHGTIGAFLTALVPVMLAYNGFQMLGPLGGEICNPQRNIPRAAIFGTVSVIGLYVLVNWTYFRILGFSRVAESQYVASAATAQVLGGAGAQWATIAMMLSAFGTLHASFLVSPRIPYAMAADGCFFSFARRIQPSFHTPSGALIFQGCVAILLVLTGTYQDLYSLNMFAVWAFFVLVAMSLIRLRRKEPNLSSRYRLWGYPWTPLAFSAAAAGISINLWLVRPVRSTIGLTIILLGIPFFHFWRRRLISSRIDRVKQLA